MNLFKMNAFLSYFPLNDINVQFTFKVNMDLFLNKSFAKSFYKKAFLAILEGQNSKIFLSRRTQPRWTLLRYYKRGPSNK